MIVLIVKRNWTTGKPIVTQSMDFPNAYPKSMKIFRLSIFWMSFIIIATRPIREVLR